MNPKTPVPKDYGQFIGQLIAYLDRSALPLERKVYYQAALLSGFLSEELFQEMMAEMDEARMNLESEMTELEGLTKQAYETYQAEKTRYFAAAKQRIKALQKLKNALVIEAENTIENLLENDSEAEIASIQNKLNKHE